MLSEFLVRLWEWRAFRRYNKITKLNKSLDEIFEDLERRGVSKAPVNRRYL